ncbi:uncharacterized protein FFNC_09306 [Fusarium fujikuroi]|uniref:Uncharacterized protein n=1 Tax=Fusarium fujikuroi TaxID=5127 RepID=A0A9Q9RNP9_FUSFU|nr:uncharacterized protein FFNC_09306 [Fusarium fujikuroi]VTT69328.1 unnamed protein product [Fusarium fujikuroi]
MSVNVTPSPTMNTATTVERIALTTPFSPPNSCQPSWTKNEPALDSGWHLYSSCLSFWLGLLGNVSFWRPSSSLDSILLRKVPPPEHPTPPRAKRLIEPFSGFTFDPFDRGGYVAKDFFTSGCGRWVQATTSMTQDDDTTTTALSGLSGYQDASALDGTFMVHQAWAVSWVSSERSDLTPMPLTLTDGERVSHWKPGETLPDDSRPTERFDQSQGNISTSAVWFLMIGLPIILFLMIVGCCWVCIRRKIRDRRVRRAMRDSSLSRTGEGRSSLTPVS